MVDTSKYSGLNEYLYVDGRLPSNPLKAHVTNITLLEDGPVMKSLRVEAKAPGCNSITTTIRIIDDLNKVEVINTFDKKKVYTPEAVHLAFPLKIPGAMRYDLAYGYCRTQRDQLPGSNKNFLTMEHWLDISGDRSGVTVICPDAPLFEAGNLTMDEIACGWVDSIASTQTFFSYAMNNYWETNFAAAQEGQVTFRYVIMPHMGFDAAMAEKTAISERQPLITKKGGGWQNGKASLLMLNNNELIITSIKPVNQGKEILITLYNAGTKEEIPVWENSFRKIFLTDPDGIKEQADEKNAIPPGGIRYYKATL
jgi:hypothetical protein